MAKNETAKTEEKVEKVVVEIIRGRMPLAVVATIKHEMRTNPDMKDAELAAKYRTTNGKVSDLRKGSNFAYVTEDFKPTQDMVDAAKVYTDQLEDSKGVTKIMSDLGIATEDEAKAFAESRKGSRKPRGKAKADAKSEVDAAEDAAEEPADETESDEDLDDLLS